MRLSFIIPLYNNLPLTQAMLASLRATLPAGMETEIILVDDGSTDGSREWLRTLPAPCRSVLNERNLGFAGACNRGAAEATGEFLFFLNNDLVLLPGWFEPMLDLLRRSDAGLVGNVQLNHASGAVDHAGIFFNAKGKPEHRTDRGFGRQRCVDAVTGACFGIRRDLWVQLGGFDEGYVNGCEDVDLGLRAAQAGRRNRVALRSVVRHHVSASHGRKLRDEQNTRRLFRRWAAVIVPRITRRCAADCLAAAWEEPRDYPDPALARDAFLHLAGLRPRPGPRLLGAAQARLDVELARWAQLLDGAAAPEERELAWQFFPAAPAPAPVL
jgi:GT2 family glycosyltransferase